ncbi:Sulfate permease and related transporters (MFS superfamily) [Hahella chejuensis KCTC 2396]|uniref:Sulfate permease and related transporters (MFS superfamily) n=1 Tax=Hahella chejuensis (strain KCTC 2396) TaxID=349521 RepID=Q2SDB2_HAHCH|nr:C4-dicarboxylic acid transporter DauA [Hahella chejuensis]ABC31362.1 Sulfate permease and related transporters (MFS superfamily) [Hahella chejuensis KCTC 2396]
MPHRAHLRSVRLASAFVDSCIKEPYNLHRFRKDLIAGVTVGIIAIPLAMALAIASGVPPQHGLYTAMIAGFLIALTGGSRLSISGPTAAFVVILFPIASQFGLAGLLMATLMSGFILVGLALARLGRLIEYIPESVTLGFTSGIAIVIATLQVKDFFGLSLAEMPESYIGKVHALALALPTLDWANVLVASLTLALLILWPRLKMPIPGHLPAVLLGVAVSLALGSAGHPVDTIGSRFTYPLADGGVGHGIPSLFPDFTWPWLQPGPDGQPLAWTWSTFEQLLPAAFSIAMLGAIESLLCAVVLDGMTGRRHQANGELLGQGIGNLVVPFFGGITATAAIARSTANYRSGAESPVSGMVHAAVVLAGLIALGPLLAYLPMASMAALLLMVAWNMSEAHKVVALIKKAPTGDILVLMTCLTLTVLFDMVLAISAGIVLAALLFMRDISMMTKVSDISAHPKLVSTPLPDNWAVYKINGPLFFAAADRVFSELEMLTTTKQGLILYMDAVSLLDAGGLSAFNKFSRLCQQRGQTLILADLQFQPLRTLAKANVKPVEGSLGFAPTLSDALQLIINQADK